MKYYFRGLKLGKLNDSNDLVKMIQRRSTWFLFNFLP